MDAQFCQRHSGLCCASSRVGKYSQFIPGKPESLTLQQGRENNLLLALFFPNIFDLALYEVTAHL